MVPFYLISDQSTGLENMPEKLFCEIPCEIEGGKVVHFFGDDEDLHVQFFFTWHLFQLYYVVDYLLGFCSCINLKIGLVLLLSK